jgi:putative membrane protein
MRSISFAAILLLAGGLADRPGLAAATDVDEEFVAKATEANIAEIQEAQRAERRAGSPAVKTYAQRMIKDHSESLKALKDLTSKWTDLGQPAKPSTEQAAQQERLKDEAGTVFDPIYARMQIEDHQKTIAVFEREAESGGDPALRAFAVKQLPILHEHLEMARKLPGGGQ